MTIQTGAARILASCAVLLAAHAHAAEVVEQRASAPAAAPRGAGGETTGGDTTLNQDGGLFRDTTYKVETKINPSFSINSQMRLQPPSAALDNDGAGVGAVAADRGLYLDQLYAKYENDRAGLRFGKYDNLAFGVARQAGRDVGMFGHDSPLDDYRLNRALGVNPFAKYDAGVAGQTRLDASVFRPEDATGSAAIGTQAGDGRPSSSAASMAMSFDGSKPFQVDGLGYHVGLQHLAPDQATDAAERNGAAAGLSYGTQVLGNKLSTSAELGYMREGTGSGETLRPGMALQGALNDTWRAFANYSRAYTPAEAATEGGERRYGAGLGYRFSQGPTLDMSWQRRAEADQGVDATRKDDVGLRMRYDLKF